MDAEHLFEKNLRERNITFKKLEDGRYEVNANGGVNKISLDNVKRNFLRDGDPKVISRFVENILQKVDELPAWDKLSLHIYPSLEPLDNSRLADIVHQPLSDSSVVSLAYFNQQSNLLHWISESDLKKNGIDSKTAWETANKNLDAILDKTNIEFSEMDGQFIGFIEAHEPYKASLILSKKLKQKVSAKIGWPIYAVAPARDFVYLFSKDSGLVNKVGSVVVQEFNDSGYPISTEVWELSDKGVEAIGEFPTQ